VIIAETELAGCFLIDIERIEDARGFFARTFSADEFGQHGMSPTVVECSASFNLRRGTLRGLHYQAAPHTETKLVRCTQGRIFDVAVDVRPGSPTLHRWIAVELSSANRRSLYLPEGVAHGFITLEPASEVSYQMSRRYVPGFSRGLRWDDPALAIAWPAIDGELTISERDRSWPLLDPRGVEALSDPGG
jgi:dTDP-4-dehydrorhamnose 3,5-epimerase